MVTLDSPRAASLPSQLGGVQLNLESGCAVAAALSLTSSSMRRGSTTHDMAPSLDEPGCHSHDPSRIAP
jgi:hypothetical protein